MIWEWDRKAPHAPPSGESAADINNVGNQGDGVVTCRQMCKGHAASVDCVDVNSSSSRVCGVLLVLTGNTEVLFNNNYIYYITLFISCLNKFFSTIIIINTW